MAHVLWYISVRLGSCQTLLATNFNILIISVDPERMGQWVKKANRVIQWKNYCLDAESMASNLWMQWAAVMLNSYVPPVVQAGRVSHSYSINEFCSFYFQKSWVRGFKALLTLGIVFGWAANSTEDNSIFVTSRWTAFLIEILSASILDKLAGLQGLLHENK